MTKAVNQSGEGWWLAGPHPFLNVCSSQKMRCSGPECDMRGTQRRWEESFEGKSCQKVLKAAVANRSLPDSFQYRTYEGRCDGHDRRICEVTDGGDGSFFVLCWLIQEEPINKQFMCGNT